MIDNKVNLPDTSRSLDVFGLGAFARQLVQPIAMGIGKILGPRQRLREDEAQRLAFLDWDDALKEKGYRPESIDLTLSERTEVRVHAERIREQRNRESIAWEAIEHSAHDDHPVNEGLPAPDADWINHFWRLAERVSDAEMQAFWGLVLERRSTGRALFSARSLEFLATLAGDEARELERLAKCIVSTEIDGIIEAGIMYNVETLSIENKEMQSRAREINEELVRVLNPIRADLFGPLGVYREEGYAHSFRVRHSADRVMTFEVAGQRMLCQPAPKPDEWGLITVGSGIALSPLGFELVQMLKPEPNPEYLEVLTRCFAAKGMKLSSG